MRAKLALSPDQQLLGVLLHTPSLFTEFFFKDDLTDVYGVTHRLSERQLLLSNDTSDHVIAATGRKTGKTLCRQESEIIRDGMMNYGKTTEMMVVNPGEKQKDQLWSRVIGHIQHNPLFKMLSAPANVNQGTMRWHGGVIHYWRIEGTDGSDRGMVGLRAAKVYVDEFQLGTKKCHDSRIQSALPGAKIFCSGVPDGRRDTIFWMIDQTPLGRSWSHHKFSTYANPIYWDKKELDKKKHDEYKGERDPEYITQVLGQWVGLMLSAFPPESIAVWVPDTGPEGTVRAGARVIRGSGYSFIRLTSKDIPSEMGDPLERMRLSSKLRIPRIQDADLFIIGGDLGFRQDPCEIGIAYRTTKSDDWIQFVRIEIVGSDPTHIAFFMQYLVEIVGMDKIAIVCLDLTGPGQGVGSNLNVSSPTRAWWSRHLIDFNAGGTVEVVNEITVADGEQPGPQNIVKVGRKEYFTMKLQSAMVAAKNNLESDVRMVIADDDEVIEELEATRQVKVQVGMRIVIKYLPPSAGPHLPIDHNTDCLRALICAALETQNLGTEDDSEPQVAMTATPLFPTRKPINYFT